MITPQVSNMDFDWLMFSVFVIYFHVMTSIIFNTWAYLQIQIQILY